SVGARDRPDGEPGVAADERAVRQRRPTAAGAAVRPDRLLGARSQCWRGLRILIGENCWHRGFTGKPQPETRPAWERPRRARRLARRGRSARVNRAGVFSGTLSLLVLHLTNPLHLVHLHLRQPCRTAVPARPAGSWWPRKTRRAGDTRPHLPFRKSPPSKVPE